MQIITLKRDRGVPVIVVIPNKKARLRIENPSKVDLHVVKSLQIINKENMSQLQRTTQTLRKGNIYVEWGVMTKIKEQSHDLDDYFSVENMLFICCWVR